MTYSRQYECDLKPLRDAFLRSDMTAVDVANRLGWKYRDTGHADGPRVTRALGLRPTGASKHSPAHVQERCTYERAVQLAWALDVDPVDVEI